MMFRNLFKVFALIVLFLLAAPAMAQDGGLVVTEVNPVISDVGAVVAALLIAIIALGGFWLIGQALTHIYIQVPQPVIQDIFTFVEKTILNAQEQAQKTQTPVDDLVVQIGRYPVEALAEYLRGQGWGVVKPDVIEVNNAIYGNGNEEAPKS